MKKTNKNILMWWGAFTLLIILLTIPYWFNDSDSYLIWGNNWSFFFISLAGIMKALMDTSHFHFDKSIFIGKNKYFWNPEFSWLNKYEEKNRVDFVRKKFLKYIPVPVFLTDFWHLAQSFQITLMCMALTYAASHPEISHGIIIDFLAYSFLYRAFFFLFYKYFLIKR